MLVDKDRHDGSVDHAESLNSVDLERRAHDTLVAERAHCSGPGLVIGRDGRFTNEVDNVFVALDLGSRDDFSIGRTNGVFPRIHGEWDARDALRLLREVSLATYAKEG